MNDLVNLSISKKMFARLQKLAVPLVDDTSSVIEKLIVHWENNPPSDVGTKSTVKAALEVWRSPRGDVLPVGATLQGVYFKNTFQAVVEKNGVRFEGKLYKNLSPAGQAAKEKAGATGPTAITNGRHFWHIQDPVSEQWIPVKALRPSIVIDSEALLAGLANLP